MQRFSANLGFLWSELDLISAIHRAKVSGFDGVEFHWPYDVNAEELGKVLIKNNLETATISSSELQRNMLRLTQKKTIRFNVTIMP